MTSTREFTIVSKNCQVQGKSHPESLEWIEAVQ